jgi:hypothetical protein
VLFVGNKYKEIGIVRQGECGTSINQDIVASGSALGLKDAWHILQSRQSNAYKQYYSRIWHCQK